MNKLPILIFASIFTFFMMLTYNGNVQAQDLEDSDLVTNPADITFGVGLTSGSSVGLLENGEVGLTGQIYFTINEQFRTGVDFTYYLIGERQLNANEVNFNVHYFLRNRNRVTLYGLGGINISNTSGSDNLWRVERGIGNPDTRKFGVNIGAGIDLQVRGLLFYAEPKLSVLSWNQFAITGGVRFLL